MIQQTKGRIFLADQRGVQETAGYQGRYTFNFGRYFNEHKHAFGDVYLLNDDILAGGGTLKMPAKETSYIVLIPVAGAINCIHTAGHHSLVAAGQVLLMTAGQGDAITVSNPFSDHPINCLQIWIRAGKTREMRAALLYTYPDVNEHLNGMVALTGGNRTALQTAFTISLGKFSGRGETVYLPKNNNAGIFIFIIEGAFEVEGRLLHARDGLALWDTGAVEMEALSNDAIIMTIELSGVMA